MGQRNVPYNHHITNSGANQQSQEPRVFYGSYTASPHPNYVHTTIVPPAGNTGNFYPHHLPYQPEGALTYGMPPPYGVQPWHPAPNAAAYASSSNQVNYVGQPYQFPGNPSLCFPFNGETTPPWAWNQAVPLPYQPGVAGGYVLDGGNMGMQGYQASSSNGAGMTSFMPPPIHHGPMMFSPQMAASSSRSHLPSSSSNNTNIPLQGVVEGGVPRYIPPHRRRAFMHAANARHQNLPNMRGFPGNGGPMLNAAVDQHIDMRLDIDHMSYEELLALGERMGKVKIGLSEENIVTNLKTRIFMSLETECVLESVACQDQKTDICVICQNEYNEKEEIGILSCDHEFHQECITTWLLLKNECPICKSGELSLKS